MDAKQIRFDAAFAQLHLALSGKTNTIVMYHDKVITVAYHNTHVSRPLSSEHRELHTAPRLGRCLSIRVVILPH